MASGMAGQFDPEILPLPTLQNNFRSVKQAVSGLGMMYEFRMMLS